MLESLRFKSVSLDDGDVDVELFEKKSAFIPTLNSRNRWMLGFLIVLVVYVIKRYHDFIVWT
jgi:hypothetical protein